MLWSECPKSDQTTEHDQTAGERVEQELHRCRMTLGNRADTVTTNHQEQRDQHRFEGNVEDHQVTRCEDDDHERFEEEDEGRVRARIRFTFIFVPTGDQNDRNQDDSKKDHNQGQGVDAEGP